MTREPENWNENERSHKTTFWDYVLFFYHLAKEVLR